MVLQFLQPNYFCAIYFTRQNNWRNIGRGGGRELEQLSSGVITSSSYKISTYQVAVPLLKTSGSMNSPSPSQQNKEEKGHQREHKVWLLWKCGCYHLYWDKEWWSLEQTFHGLWQALLVSLKVLQGMNKNTMLSVTDRRCRVSRSRWQ